jgi:catechol 2,3-dioxygenase-like lactoylglutathione lyase family enzyme
VVTLGVSDLAASRRFYEQGLGLPARPESSDDVVFFGLKGAWLALWPRTELARDAGISPDSSGFSGICLAHNVATKQDVDLTMAEVLRAGGSIVKPPQDAFWGGYLGYFADPDGFLWEVTWNPDMPELVS